MRNFAPLAAALLATLITGAGTAHAGDKPYSLTLTPQVSEAATATTYTARIVNRSPNQMLGSVNLAAPAVFALSAPAVMGVGTATTDGSTVFIRNLSLAPGRSVDVRVSADTTAASGEWEWSSQAKQANGFNGTGNDFVLDGARSDQSVTVDGSPNGLTVECPEETSGVPTEMCEGELTHRGFISETLAGAGLSLLPAGAVPFTVNMDVVAEPELPNNAGTLTLKLPYSNNLDCPTLVPSSPVTGYATGPMGRAKTVRITVDHAAPLTTEPAGVCYAAPYPFAFTAPGMPFMDSGQLFVVGVLADCVAGSELVTPCTSERALVGGNHVVTVEIPALLPDPAMRP